MHTKATGDGASADLIKPITSVPPLDFSKLSNTTSSNSSSSSTTAISSSASLLALANQQPEDDSAPRKSFELTFQRQARFATLLKKK